MFLCDVYEICDFTFLLRAFQSLSGPRESVLPPTCPPVPVLTRAGLNLKPCNETDISAAVHLSDTKVRLGSRCADKSKQHATKV